MIIQEKDKGIFYTALSNYANQLEEDLKILAALDNKSLLKLQRDTLKRTYEILEEL